MDPHIFADPDPGSQNLADPTDPDLDPNHCLKQICAQKIQLQSLKCPRGRVIKEIIFKYLCVQSWA